MKWLKWVGIVVAALVIIPLAVLLVMGQRSNAGRVHVSVEIAASPEHVWTWVDDGQKLKQWVSWLVDVKGWDQQRGVGMKGVWVMKDENNGGAMMEINGTCSEYAPPSRLTVQLSVKDAFDGEQSYRLADLGNGRTRLEVLGRYHFTNPLAQLMEPLIMPQAEKKLMGDMARLKSLVESKAEVR